MKYRYLSYFFRIAITLTICVSANNLCSNPPEISGFAYPKLAGNRRDMSQRLGDLLVKEKVITPEQLEQATKVQKRRNSASARLW